MMLVDRRSWIFALALVHVCLPLRDAAAQVNDGIKRTPDNLMVVLRESFGSNKQDETLVPFERLRTRLQDGREVDVRIAAFEYLGDMHIRFVFDGPQFMPVARPDDLVRLNLTPDSALPLAISNIKRVYGAPTVTPWTAGLMQVEGQSADLNSSYFLDRDFWNGLLQRHPKGLVAAVPKRGGLVFAPISDRETVETLRKGVAYLHSSSKHLRVSSALYLFKDGHWAVFQPPAATDPP